MRHVSADCPYLTRIAQIFSTGDIEAVGQLFAADYRDHQRPDWLNVDGPTEFIAIVMSARSALPNLHVWVAGAPLRQDDLEVALLHWSSQAGDGRTVERDTVETLRIESGRVAEHWGIEVRSTTQASGDR
jgi:predicted SnoaL-like aldol condensation-catalyzing enzyme